MNLSNVEEIKALQANLHACFGSPQGKEVLKYMEQLCHWTPTIYDSNDTNDIIARDASRKIYGTIKTFLELNPEQLAALAQRSQDAI